MTSDNIQRDAFVAVVSKQRILRPQSKMQPNFQYGAMTGQMLRSKVSFESNSEGAIRNTPKNKCVLLHDLEVVQDTIFSILNKQKP